MKCLSSSTARCSKPERHAEKRSLVHGKFITSIDICNILVKQNVNLKKMLRWYFYIHSLTGNSKVENLQGELKEIQNEDTSPSKNTNEIPMEVEYFEPPQEEVVLVRRGSYEPTNYKAATLYQESNKWLDAMNAKIQSMKDNQVWRLVDLPPNAKGFTQTYGVDYEETFSPVADIRAIRIL
ncbi:retrotransposon protein, putative, ty1-copia subclass, partial [Tanacetum coccineum]